MMRSIGEVMTTQPVCLDAQSTVEEAARLMREKDVGDVLVTSDGKLCGIVTDRDIVIRGLAEGADMRSCTLGEICSKDLVCLSPQDSVEDALRMMREHAIRRLPIVENDTPVGMVSLGDLAIQEDPRSALADISAAPPSD